MSNHKYILLPYAEYLRHQNTRPKPANSEKLTTDLKSAINTPGIDDSTLIDKLTNIMSDYVDDMKNESLSKKAPDSLKKTLQVRTNERWPQESEDIRNEGNSYQNVTSHEKPTSDTVQHHRKEESENQFVTSEEQHKNNLTTGSIQDNKEKEKTWNKDIYPDVPETSPKTPKGNEEDTTKRRNGSNIKTKLTNTDQGGTPTKLRRSQRKPKPIAKLRNHYISLD